MARQAARACPPHRSTGHEVAFFSLGVLHEVEEADVGRDASSSPSDVHGLRVSGVAHALREGRAARGRLFGPVSKSA